MGLSDEDRRRIYEEERAREEVREEIQRESKQRKLKQGCLGCLGIIGVALAVGLLVGLLDVFGVIDGDSAPETTPVPKDMVLDFATLREWPLGGGGIGAEIVVGEGSSKEQLLILGRFLRDVAWPNGYLSILIYDNAEAWEARGLCEQAYKGIPVAKLDEIERGPICTRATQLEKEHLLLDVRRNLSTGQAKSLWIGPEQP
jgi:hypothetical protein